LLNGNSPHLAGKPRFFEQSENHLPRDRPAFVPQFSERNRGSSFFERKWTAGSMSRSSLHHEAAATLICFINETCFVVMARALVGAGSAGTHCRNPR
jgi:hypothetical protein